MIFILFCDVQVISVACCVFYSHCGNRAPIGEEVQSGHFGWKSRILRMHDQACSSWFAPVGSGSDYPLLASWAFYREVWSHCSFLIC